MRRKVSISVGVSKFLVYDWRSFSCGKISGMAYALAATAGICNDFHDEFGYWGYEDPTEGAPPVNKQSGFEDPSGFYSSTEVPSTEFPSTEDSASKGSSGEDPMSGNSTGGNSTNGDSGMGNYKFYSFQPAETASSLVNYTTLFTENLLDFTLGSLIYDPEKSVLTSVFKCTNGSVIEVEKVCDYNNDCGDNSDEAAQCWNR